MEKAQTPPLTLDQQRALLEKLLRLQAAQAKQFPMSSGQQGLWHAYRRNPQQTEFNVFLPTRIRGPLQPESLKQSIQLVASRHAALRTTFSDSSGQLLQTVHDQLEPEFLMVPMLGASEDRLRQELDQEMRRPFDLEKGPLLRIVVYQLAADDWIVMALTHHIIVDFWSLILILMELREAYPQLVAGQAPDLPPVVDNYRQYVSQQTDLLNGTACQPLIDFWQKTLADIPPVLDIPTDRPRPAAFTHRADCVVIPLSHGVSQRVIGLAGQMRATAFAVVHAAMQFLLSRYGRQEAFFVGSPFSGRSQQKFEQTVGFFINMLPVRCQIRPDQTFASLVQQTTLQLIETMEHEAYPISEIVRSAGIARDPSRSPLFQVSCTFEKAHKREESGRAGVLFPNQTRSFDFGGMRQESFYVPHPTCHYDLEFVFEQCGDELQAMLLYCRDLFDADSMRCMADNFSSLLDSLLAHPSTPLADVPWNIFSRYAPIQQSSIRVGDTLSASTVHQAGSSAVVAGKVDSASATTVHEMILRAAAKTPDHLALQAGGQQASFRDLFLVAHSLSHQLKSRGVGPESLVPVLCREGCHAFAAMLAVHLAGGAAIPIDLNQPAIDPVQLLSSPNTRVALSDSRSDLPERLAESLVIDIAMLPAAVATNRVAQAKVTPQNLAYMIYTSGSTGQPKGVLVEHGSICNTLGWRANAIQLQSTDRVLMLLSHQFDAALGNGWSALTQGAALVWPLPNARQDPTLLLQEIIQQQITVLPAVPSLLKLLVNHPLFSQCTSLRQIWTGGEALPPELPSLIRSQLPVRIWNLYGPTETAVEATALEVTERLPEKNMTIGFPIDAMQVLIVNAQHEPVPCTVPGELAVSGPGLARGYHDDPELTARKFVSHPRDPQQRMYLTGDTARQLADGQIEFLGRVDHQIKLRGYRIELGEIEAVLQSHPSIDRAAVLVHAANTSAAQLVAYLCPAVNCHIDQQALRTFLGTRLPHYKIPAAVIVLDSMPLTTSGKVDRRRLPQDLPTQSWLQEVVPPRTALETYLVEKWSAELKLSTIGIHQNFFEAGGSSLQAAVMTTQLSNDLGVHVPTALLFDLADIAQVSRRLVEIHPQAMVDRFGLTCVEFYQHESTAANSAQHPLLASLKPTGGHSPIFMVHPPGGIVVCYRELAQHLPAEQPFWAIRSRGLHGSESLPTSIEQMAAEYLQAMRSIQPHGPYVLGGWSLGGLVAYEMARQLLQQDAKTLRQLIFLDTTIPEGSTDCVPTDEQVNVGLEYGIELTLDQLGELTPQQQLPLLHSHADKLGILDRQSPPEVVERVLADLQHLFHHHVSLSRKYRLQPIAAKLLLLRPQEVPFDLKVSEDRGWRHLVQQVDVRFVPGHHHSMVQSPHVQQLVQVMMQELD